MRNRTPAQTALPIGGSLQAEPRGRGSMPAWLRQHLEDTGALDGDRITRTVQHRTCSKCGASVLVGYDSDVSAMAVTVDPTPLDPEGELFAILKGRMTYRLYHWGGRYELDARVWMTRRHQPAGTLDRHGTQIDVLPTHSCGDPIPANGPPIQDRTNRPGVEIDDGSIPF